MRITIKDVKCSWCNNKAVIYYKNFPEKGHNIYKCLKCGIMFQSPIPNINKLYSTEYFETWGDENLLSITKKENFRILISLLNNYNILNTKTLFDIGAAQGFLMEVAEEQGWESSGIEMSRNVQSLNKYIQKKIVYGDFKDIRFEKNKFSAITSISVFEHIPDPIVFVKKVNNLLKRDGLWLVLVPNLNSLSCKILGKRWPHFNLPHIFYYNCNFFKKELSKYDFTPIYCKPHYSVYSIFYILNQIKINSKGIISSFAEISLKLLPSFVLRKKLKLSGGNLLIIFRKK
jgi:SAM-dependent methyltransferase